MNKLFNDFRSLTGISKTDLSKISGMARQYISAGVNKPHKQSNMMVGSILKHMEKQLVKQLDNITKKYTKLIERVQREGKKYE